MRQILIVFCNQNFPHTFINSDRVYSSAVDRCNNRINRSFNLLWHE